MSTVSDVAQRFKNSNLRETFDENRSFLLVVPGLFAWLAFMLIPMLYVVALSFTNATSSSGSNLFQGDNTIFGFVPIGQADVVWFENYLELFFSREALRGQFMDLLLSNPIALFNGEFWNSFLITWLFVVLSVTGKVVLGIAISLVMTGDRVRGKRFMRGIIILPMGVPPIFSIMVWNAVFSSARFGLMNQLLSVFGLEAVGWTQDRWPAFFAYIITEMWLAYPFMVLITVSALQNVNGELLDAAKVDGAHYLHRLRHVILPSIKRPVMFGTILTSAASFQQFLIPWVFNKGGPARSNELLMVYAYREAFDRNVRDFGTASTIVLTAVFFIGVFMWVAVKKGKLAEEAGEA
jgi:arabinogalactan oligomer/maltooligosaccharide transport system permease protein